MADQVVSHAFSHGFHPQHSERLAAYWAEALGGPYTYSERYGDETTVVRIHSGNGPHEEMNQRAIACFDQALEDAGITEEPLRQVLHVYFAWATTTTMSAYHGSADDVPQSLSIPRWSWDGLQPSQLGAAAPKTTGDGRHNRPRKLPRSLDRRRDATKVRQAAMTFAVGSSLYPRPINTTRGEQHDRYLHLRRLFQPRWLRLRQRRRLGRLLGQAGA